jgi:hypothetical protein
VNSSGVVCPTNSFDAGGGGAAVAVGEALQLGQIHVLLDACVVGRVEFFVAGRAGAGGEVLHGGAHRVSSALREAHTGVRALAQPALLQNTEQT